MSAGPVLIPIGAACSDGHPLVGAPVCLDSSGDRARSMVAEQLLPEVVEKLAAVPASRRVLYLSNFGYEVLAPGVGGTLDEIAIRRAVLDWRIPPGRTMKLMAGLAQQISAKVKGGLARTIVEVETGVGEITDYLCSQAGDAAFRRSVPAAVGAALTGFSIGSDRYHTPNFNAAMNVIAGYAGKLVSARVCEDLAVLRQLGPVAIATGGFAGDMAWSVQSVFGAPCTPWPLPGGGRFVPASEIYAPKFVTATPAPECAGFPAWSALLVAVDWARCHTAAGVAALPILPTMAASKFSARQLAALYAHVLSSLGPASQGGLVAVWNEAGGVPAPAGEVAACANVFAAAAAALHDGDRCSLRVDFASPVLQTNGVVTRREEFESWGSSTPSTVAAAAGGGAT